VSRAWRAPLVAIAASLGLIAVYLAFGGATYDPAEVADPCQQRDQALLEERSVFETIALSGLDGAACELGVPREELALALTSEEATDEFAAKHGLDSGDVEDAVRAGLVRAVDDAAAAGRIDGFEETILHQVAEHAPVGPAIDALQALSGDDSVQGLLEQLGSLQDLGLPDGGGLPSVDDLKGLLGG
jgi:hypothetical protein